MTFAVLMLLAVVMTQVIENAAVAVLLAPISFEVARACGADPRPFVLGVAICVSAAFVTPIAHESTILVMGPGRYRFRDYVVMGLPLAVLTWIVTVIVVPWLWPLMG